VGRAESAVGDEAVLLGSLRATFGRTFWQFIARGAGCQEWSLPKWALSAVMASLLDHKAILTTEEQATLATIGAHVEMRVRDLQEIHQEWMGADQL
jgi:hypothetical protein